MKRNANIHYDVVWVVAVSKTLRTERKEMMVVKWLLLPSGRWNSAFYSFGQQESDFKCFSVLSISLFYLSFRIRIKRGLPFWRRRILCNVKLPLR